MKPSISSVPVMQGVADELFLILIPESGEGIPLLNVDVKIYENGMVYYETLTECGTVHLSRCDVLWRAAVDFDPIGAGKVTPITRKK